MFHRCPSYLKWGWCGQCYADMSRGNSFPHWRPPRKKKWRFDMALSNSFKPVSGADGHLVDIPASTDGEIGKKFPTLAAFLTETQWDGGSPRVPASLMIFTQDGMWKAMLNDRDCGRVAFVSKNEFTALFQALEKGLATDGLDWRKSKDNPPARKKT